LGEAFMPVFMGRFCTAGSATTMLSSTGFLIRFWFFKFFAHRDASPGFYLFSFLFQLDEIKFVIMRLHKPS
jgi:hypothetical protein